VVYIPSGENSKMHTLSIFLKLKKKEGQIEVNHRIEERIIIIFASE